MRLRSAQSFFSISATWSSGSKSNCGTAPWVRTTVLKLSSGPTGAPLPRYVRHPHQQRVEKGFLLIQPLLEFRRLCACFFRSRPERSTFFRCGILERGADAVPLGTQIVDLSPQMAYLGGCHDQGVQVQADALVPDCPLNELQIGPYEIQSQHGRGTARIARRPQVRLSAGHALRSDRSPRRCRHHRQARRRVRSTTSASQSARPERRRPAWSSTIRL